MVLQHVFSPPNRKKRYQGDVTHLLLLPEGCLSGCLLLLLLIGSCRSCSCCIRPCHVLVVGIICSSGRRGSCCCTVTVCSCLSAAPSSTVAPCGTVGGCRCSCRWGCGCSWFLGPVASTDSASNTNKSLLGQGSRKLYSY